MSDTTITADVKFGDKVRFSKTEAGSYSTIVIIDEVALAHSIPYYSGTFKTVDYSDEKKMETYRKVNKMLGGK